ncbi:TraR/DksA family transcriptional regulator [Nitratidesulfovibrio termitidis]|uniref:TraR/DksA family transcriptional regulator n=1 Tax=Nitratidesulfovibrio termitidis TaxID=42252 RepID=UPI00040FA211|nr:TraR/DksA C4-type zinc finger protein [Nitratidesulfovibrio termitidis]
MTDRHHAEIRRRLEAELTHLRRQLLVEGGVEACADENEFASRVSELALSMTLLDRAGRRIREIEGVLRAMDRHDYGVCDACGDDIPLPRLLARPTTRLCVHCQMEQETQTGRPVAATAHAGAH